jgi:RimJ/RimL family protein N-acetyltransferase
MSGKGGALAVVIIREAAEADAEQLLALAHQLDRETKFMLLEPGERTTDPAVQRERIRTGLAQGNLTLVADAGGRLVGLLGLTRGADRRNRHAGHIFIGICQEFTRQGIGTRLFADMERWAREKGLHRLELTVMAHNAAGRALYQKLGFEIEGTLRHSLCVDGQWIDEYAMAKLL